MEEEDSDDDSDNGETALTLERTTAVPRPKRVVAAMACLCNNMNARVSLSGRHLLRLAWRGAYNRKPRDGGTRDVRATLMTRGIAQLRM